MGIGGNGNGNDSMGVGREWEEESHSRTPLLQRAKARIHVQMSSETTAARCNGCSCK